MKKVIVIGLDGFEPKIVELMLARDVLDSVPSDPGHGEFRTLWHVFAVAPAAYSFLTGGDSANDDAVAAAYASYLPAKSEAEVDALVDSTLPDVTPVAVEIDTNSYFLCAVVNHKAAR
jgi:hypothetical protein